MYSLLSEGYTDDFKVEDESRETHLKSDIWVRTITIPDLLKNRDAISAINFYQRWKLLGLPFGDWGFNPNKLVELIEFLDPLDRLYHPKMTI